jgi:hypothetical protein
MTCACAEIMPAWALPDHVRVLHPDADAVPEDWPDGTQVVRDDTGPVPAYGTVGSSL